MQTSLNDHDPLLIDKAAEKNFGIDTAHMKQLRDEWETLPDNVQKKYAGDIRKWMQAPAPNGPGLSLNATGKQNGLVDAYFEAQGKTAHDQADAAKWGIGADQLKWLNKYFDDRDQFYKTPPNKKPDGWPASFDAFISDAKFGPGFAEGQDNAGK